MEQSSNKGLFIGTIVVAVLIFLGLIWAVLSVPSDGGVTTLPSGQVSFNDENDPSIGPDDSKVVVRLFEDLECPACKLAEPGVSYAIDKYSDRVRFIWNDFPLDSIHKNARTGANAARCAEEQGKFWEYKSLLYSEQNSWVERADPTESFVAYVSQLQLNTDDFRACYKEKRYDAKISADVAEAGRNRINSTPTIFTNDVMRHGLSPTEWDTVLTTALAQ